MAEPPRLACAHLPALPLQTLRREHPEWNGRPLVVVEDDRASARITFVDRRAHERGIVVGMRYATAQSLLPGLCADVVDERRLIAGTDELVQALLRVTPRVEAAGPGTFFLDPRGMHRVHASLDRWAESVHRTITTRRYRANLVVGFGRERVAALARSSDDGRVRVLRDEADELALAGRLPLVAFGAQVGLVHDLGRLGIRTADELARIPPLELAMRFGPEALALQNRTTGRVVAAFSSVDEVETIHVVLEVDPPDDDVGRLLFGIKRLLDTLAIRLRERGEALVEASVELTLDHAGARVEALRPSRPDLDVASWLELFRLRLERRRLEAPVTRMAVTCESVAARADQLALSLDGARPRDLAAAARALARLAALYGPERVTRLALREAHLPEARFEHVPTTSLALPKQVGIEPVPIVRRCRRRPTTLAGTRSAGEHQPLGRMHESGAVVAMHGPMRVSGGWWVREVSRDYYFVETESGAVLWVYRDGARKRWYGHGELD